MSIGIPSSCTSLDIRVHFCDLPEPMTDSADDQETESGDEHRVVVQLNARDLHLLERLRTTLREDVRLTRMDALRILIREKGRELFGDDAAA